MSRISRRKMKIINTPSRNAIPTTPEGLLIRPMITTKILHTRVPWICWLNLIPIRLLIGDQEAQITQERTSRGMSTTMITRMRQILMIFSTEATKRKTKIRAVSRENWNITLVSILSPITRHLKEQVVMRALAKDAVRWIRVVRGVIPKEQENWRAGENEHINLN